MLPEILHIHVSSGTQSCTCGGKVFQNYKKKAIPVGAPCDCIDHAQIIIASPLVSLCRATPSQTGL